MPERAFLTETWDSDEWFQELDIIPRYLFIYLWTNEHCNQAGLYYITLSTLSFATKIPKADLPGLLESLAPKVKWYPKENLVWVKNFIKRQSKSPKFLAAAAKSLTTIKHNGAIKELLDYNLERYSISIPYQYYIDRVSIPTTTDTTTVTDLSSSGVVRGEENILKRLAKLRGWQADDDDITWLRDFTGEFPDFTLAELRACIDYNSGKPPPKHKGIWKNRFRNWMRKKREFEHKEAPGPRGKSFEQFMKEQQEGS